VNAAVRLGIPYVNVHLGAHTGAGVERGIENDADALGAVEVPDGVTILFEDDAGAGTKLCGDFEHLAAARARSGLELGICLDTAHLFAAGYDLTWTAAVEATIDEFDRVVGLDQLRAVHLNDSKHGLGTRKDQHGHIGEGEIGPEGLAAVVDHSAVRALPLVLETPIEDGKDDARNVERVQELRAS